MHLTDDLLRGEKTRLGAIRPEDIDARSYGLLRPEWKNARQGEKP